MEQICCIMVVDGFSPRIWTPDGRTYRTAFLVRELSYAKLDGQSPPKSFRFDLRDQIDTGSIRKNGKTLTHQSKMTGLSVHPAPREAGVRPYSELPDIVRDMHRECSRDGVTLVGHKGGHNESALLESLGIPYADMQLYGCPKYDLLVRSGQDGGGGKVWECGYHSPARSPAQCPMAKVVAYRDWCLGILKSEEYSSISKSNEKEE